MAHTFKILGAFLTYPEALLKTEASALEGVLIEEGLLDKSALKTLHPFIHRLATRDLTDQQEDYVDLFDRSRTLSLHLFEHIHGESRDRGQAMVDLMTLYEQRGLKLDARELPDYLPLFLEFLSTLEVDEACEFLGETAHVIEALADRLDKRKASHARVMRVLLSLAAEPAGEAEDLQTEDVDPDDLEALDRDWAEEPVTFGPGEGGCPVAEGMLSRMNAPLVHENQPSFQEGDV